MDAMQQPEVEHIPANLDDFLSTFFSRGGWRSEIKYDHAEDRLYLNVRLERAKLSADDRFLSLVEYYTRAQDAALRQRSGLPLRCRLFAADGRELTITLHTRGSSYLDDNARGSGMRRRLLWLGFRRRFLVRVVPGALLWALAFAFLVAVAGVPFDVVILVAIGALIVQSLVLFSLAGRRR
jgi:hypothetical protein